MIKRTRVLPYKQGSRSAKALAQALGCLRLRVDGSSKFQKRAGDTVINWGNSALAGDASLNNNTEVLLRATNKLQFFNLCKDEDWCPSFWTDADDIPDESFPIVCRTILSGHSGAGIVIAESRDDLVSAPLYVQYKKKKEEYRIHVGGSSIISVQQKKRRLSEENPDWKVRNLAGGFIFARSDVSPPPEVLEVAKQALHLSQLDFGAVDVIWNAKHEKAYVLEINTAPGLEGTTIDDYVKYFEGLDNA